MKIFRAEQPLLSAKPYLPIKSRVQPNIKFYQKDSITKSVLPSSGCLTRQNMQHRFTTAYHLQQTRSQHLQTIIVRRLGGAASKFLRDTYIGFKHGIEKKSTSVFYTMSQEESIKGLFFSLLYSIAFLALQFRITISIFTFGYNNIFSHIPFFIIIIIYMFSLFYVREKLFKARIKILYMFYTIISINKQAAKKAFAESPTLNFWDPTKPLRRSSKLHQPPLSYYSIQISKIVYFLKFIFNIILYVSYIFIEILIFDFFFVVELGWIRKGIIVSIIMYIIYIIYVYRSSR